MYIVHARVEASDLAAADVEVSELTVQELGAAVAIVELLYGVERVSIGGVKRAEPVAALNRRDALLERLEVHQALKEINRSRAFCMCCKPQKLVLHRLQFGVRVFVVIMQRRVIDARASFELVEGQDRSRFQLYTGFL